MENSLGSIKMEAERLHEDCEVSSKGHYNCSEFWKYVHFWLGVPASVLAAVTSVGVVTDSPTTSTVCAILTAILTGLLTFLNPNETKNAHKNSADQYLTFKKKLRIFILKIDVRPDKDELFSELEQISEEINTLCQASLTISSSAYKKAKAGLVHGEATYKADS